MSRDGGLHEASPEDRVRISGSLTAIFAGGNAVQAQGAFLAAVKEYCVAAGAGRCK